MSPILLQDYQRGFSPFPFPYQSIDRQEIDNMECYFSRDSDDRIVPNVRETSESLFEDDTYPSTESWLQWEVTRPQKVGSPSKHIVRPEKQSAGTFNFGRQSSCIKSETEPSVRNHESSSNSISGGDISVADYTTVNSGSYAQEYADSSGRPDYQLESFCQSVSGLGSTQQEDDFFTNSFLEEDPPNMEKPYESVDMFQDSECSSMSFKNFLNGMLVDSPKDGGFPLATDWALENWNQQEDIMRSHFVPAHSGRNEDLPMVPKDTILNSTKRNASDEGDTLMNKESLGEMVLQELETVMTQLNQSTRICFRDAFFRLAKCSRQHCTVDESTNTDFSLDQPAVAVVDSKGQRFNELECMESETNVIDRTIASLTFNNQRFGAPDASSLASIQLGKEALMTSCNYSKAAANHFDTLSASVITMRCQDPILG